MKKYLLIFLLINICSVQLFCQEKIETQADLEGIEDQDQLKDIAGKSGSYILTKDIELSGWTPIASFSGTLDGNGFTITNVDNKANPALFEKLNGGSKIIGLTYLCINKREETISRWGLANWRNYPRGGIANSGDSTLIKNCIVQLNYTFINAGAFNNLYLGGILGSASGTTEVNNCIVKNSTLIVKRKDNNFLTEGSSGGIIGFISGSAIKITNCTIINTTTDISGANGSENDFAGNAGNDNNIQDNNTNAGTDIPEKEIEDILNNNNSGEGGDGGDSGNTSEPVTLLSIDLSKGISPDPSKITVENVNGSVRIYNADQTTPKIILKNNTNSLDLDLYDFKGDVICSNNTVKKLTVGPQVKLGGNIATTSVELHDGCYICENGINNADGGEIIYYRNPSVFTGRNGNGGDNTGWESVCLPFNALIFAERNGETIELYPFGTTGKPAKCWMKSYANHELTADNSFRIFFDTPKVLDAQNVIVANQPYLVSFPGKAWGSKLNLEEATIYYKGYGKIINSIDQSKIYAGHSNSLKERDIRYVMNNPSECTLDHVNEKTGSQFVYTSDDVLLKPFRASVINLALQAPSGKAPTLKISYGPGSATQILNPSDMGLTIYASNGTIYIETEISYFVTICDATTGRIIAMKEINEGMNTISDLPKGVYIVEGKKVIL